MKVYTNPTPPIPPDQRDGIVGTTVTIGYGELSFSVAVKAFRSSFGRAEWLVSPIAGTGETWVRNIAPNTTPPQR
jgi:hypothetical protein